VALWTYALSALFSGEKYLLEAGHALHCGAETKEGLAIGRFRGKLAAMGDHCGAEDLEGQRLLAVFSFLLLAHGADIESCGRVQPLQP
jgi:hypothetical protein